MGRRERDGAARNSRESDTMGPSETITMDTDDTRSQRWAGDEDTGPVKSVQGKSAEEWAAREISPPYRAAVIGCGNTGSAAAFLLARYEALRELWLIDGDVYESRNMMGQSMPGGVRPGTPKVKALATAIRQIRPDLRVVPVHDWVENLAVGEVFGATAVFSNLDGQAARRWVVERAWEFGVPVIDCGVQADGRLVRVTAYVPEFELPCVLCPLDTAGGGIFEQTYPCAGDEPLVSPARTGAPAWLGAMAASLQMAEFEKIVRPGPGRLLAGAELLVDVRFHQQSVSAIPRNPACPFHHRPLMIERLESAPGDLSVARAFALALPPGTPTGGNLPRFLRGTNMSLTVPTKQFVQTMQCGACDHHQDLLRLRHRLRERDRACPRGHGRMLPTPHDIADRVHAASLAGKLSQSLFSLGFRTGERFTISGQYGERHFLLRCGRRGSGESGEEPGGFCDTDPGDARPVENESCAFGCP
jgi:molybdopterin/thiamine biosynthesis adenylyltransferase